MNIIPLFSNEIDFSKIEFLLNNDKIDNKIIYYFTHNNNNLYLQTQIFKFLQPIESKVINNKIYNEILLFLTPYDKTTNIFINLIDYIEKKCLNYINNITDNNVILNPLIKVIEINDDQQPTKYIKYIKIKLLNSTIIEYNKNQIDFNILNEMINNVNLKLIFEINTIWLSNNKIGLFLKPIKIKVIDIPSLQIIEFREENESPCDIKLSDNFINNNKIDDSILKDINDNSISHNFIPSIGIDKNSLIKSKTSSSSNISKKPISKKKNNNTDSFSETIIN